MTEETGAAVPEVGLFVLWPQGRSQQERIVDHARRLFDVRGAHEVHWAHDLAAENLARFRRRVPSPFAAPPPEQAEQGDILLLIVADPAPCHERRPGRTGPVRVNTRLLDAAAQFRVWTGATASVHVSASAPDATRDLMLLLGTDPGTYLEKNPHSWNGRIDPIHRDLSGAHGWASPVELFHALRHTVRYVVLRNFEGLPHSLHVNAHEDVDLLTDDYPELVAVMNARPNRKCIPRWGGPFWVRIGEKDRWFDLRFVGDRYYDPAWAREILDRRVWNDGGFFSPSPQDYFETLAYHAVVHKSSFSSDYGQRLAEMARSLGVSGWDPRALEDPARLRALLDGILWRRGFGYCRPRDVNVFYNFEATGHRWPSLRRKLAAFSRKAQRVGYRVQRHLAARGRTAAAVVHRTLPSATAASHVPGTLGSRSFP